MNNQFRAGFSRVNVTPPLGIAISGYFLDRFASDVLDELEANVLAVSFANQRAVLIALDNLMIDQTQMQQYRKAISEETGIAYEAVFIACTHTHTGPLVGKDPLDESRTGDKLYTEYLGRKLVDGAKLALADCAPAKMGYAVGQAPNISFIRRFRMRDGSIRTNPGVNNPEIESPIGEADQSVNVLRFVCEGAGDIVAVNFGVHPDTVGGDAISADYPRFVRETVERALPGVRCLFFNGISGDVNHVNVHPKCGDKHGLKPMFDDVDRGYQHTIHMGRVIAGSVLQVYDKVAFTSVDAVAYIQETVQARANVPAIEELESAERICALHAAGRDDEIPFSGMELTTVVAEALRMMQMKNGPETIPLDLSAVRIGPAAFVGIPGEPFTGVGRGIKAESPFAITLSCCLTNGAEGYYPMKEAYDEGGYEARSSKFKAGIAELLIQKSVSLLHQLFNS